MATILILGSNSDVGKACAYQFAKQRYDVILATRNIDDYQKMLAADLSVRFKIRAFNMYFDALKTGGHKTFFDELPLFPDVVLSVFGILGDQEKAQLNFAEADEIISTNFTGNVSILGETARKMEIEKRGTIIGVSSVAGERGRKKNYIYGASKAGLTAYLSGLRAEMHPKNVHVITVIPGFIDTKMISGMITPKALTASPEQVAKSIWLAYKKKQNIVYVLSLWRWIMLIIRNIPERIFKKLDL